MTENEEGGDGEKSRAGAPVELQTTANQGQIEDLAEVVNCIFSEIRLEHLPSGKLLVDLAELCDGEEITTEKVESFAKTLWKAYGELEETRDEGAKTRD
jgi:hypothetical protein